MTDKEIERKVNYNISEMIELEIRHKIYKYALEKIQQAYLTENYNNDICGLIAQVIMDNLIEAPNPFTHLYDYSEIWKHRPSGMVESDLTDGLTEPWFPKTKKGCRKRIKILENGTRETKPILD